MHFLFLGEDSQAKDQKLLEIRSKHLSANALNFDYENYQAVKLDAATLKKALITLPAIAKKRVICIRFAEKLSPHNKKLILEFLEQKNPPAVLILDSNESEGKNVFLKKASLRAKVVRFQTAVKQNVFDMTNAISARRPSQALKILSELLAQGDHPLQIMGAMVWFWGKNKTRISRDGYKKGLLELKEADLNIKRSRLNPQYALEKLVVNLSLLTAC